MVQKKLYHTNMLKLYVRRAIVGQLNLIDEIPTLEYLNVNYAQVVQTCVI